MKDLTLTPAKSISPFQKELSAEQSQSSNSLFTSNLFELTINSVGESIVILNMDRQIIYVNKSFIQKYGYTEDEVFTKQISMLNSEKNDPEEIEKIISNTLENSNWKSRFYHKDKNNNEFLVSLNASLIKDDEEKPVGVVAAITDLSDKIKATRELKEAEAKYESFFVETKDMVYESTPEGKLIDVNPAGVELFGYESKDEMLQVDIPKHLYTDPADRQRYKELLNNYGFAKNFEIEIRRKDGSRRVVLETGTAVKDEHGNVKAYRGIIRDVTENKKAEEQLKKYIREIASANSQLYKSEAELKKLNAAKDKFFSIIAHDLKSPFTSLIGLSDFILEDLEGLSKEEIKLFSSKINKSAKSVFALLENLLQWSRVQTGRMEYNPTVFDLYEMIEQNTNLLLGNAVKKNIDLVSEIPLNSKVYADLNMINSVVQNLISNAIKFTPNGGKIKISSKVSDHYVTISVKDDGIGIDKNDIEKLFKIDVHHTTAGTDNEKGTGLGLVLCKELINMNGGDISVESESGKGSTFKFTIPLS